MPKTLDFLFNIIVWAIVPLILFIILLLTKRTASDPDFVKQVKSINSGFWGGVTLVAIILVYKVAGFVISGFPHNPIFQGFDLWITFGTSLIILILFALKNTVAGNKTIGLSVMIITSLSLYFLIDYLLIRENNSLLLSITLGAAFGSLLHFASSPKSLKDFLERTQRTGGTTRG